MPFTIVRRDITKMKVDAIVNAANTELKMGGGVCGAIFKAAGEGKLQIACDQLAPIRTGEAVITPGFDLPAKYIIHTAGPVYHKQNADESERLLRSAYRKSLMLAIENKCESIAFPLISSGIYGYPKEESLRVASSEIQDLLLDYDVDVRLVIFDKSSFVISSQLLGAVDNYVDDHYVDMQEIKSRRLHETERKAISEADDLNILYLAEEIAPVEAGALPEDLIDNLDESFSEMLLRWVDEKGMTDVEVYKRANLDRRLFSKIRSNKDYMPSKRTAIALAIALELSLDETDAFLERAGYALSHALKFDVIVEYFIINREYNIFVINEVLFEYDQPLLGAY